MKARDTCPFIVLSHLLVNGVDSDGNNIVAGGEYGISAYGRAECTSPSGAEEGGRGQLRPSGRLGSSWWAAPRPAERRRVAASVAECAGTWGLVQRRVFMRLVPRRVPRQSHRVQFARACVRFFEKKKEGKLRKRLSSRTSSVRRDEERRDDGKGGWTRGEFTWGGEVRNEFRAAKFYLATWGKRPSYREPAFSKGQRPRAEGDAEERKSRRINERSIDPINLPAPPLSLHPPTLLTYSAARRARLHERYNVLCVWCTVQCVGANLVITISPSSAASTFAEPTTN